MRLSDRRIHLNGEMSCIVVKGHDERKDWRNRLITETVNTVFLNLPGSHRDMMRVAEIIVAFVFRSTRRVDSPLNEISDFLSCDTSAVTFNGCDSEKRTFWLKRKVGPNPELSIWCFVIFAIIFMILFPRNLTIYGHLNFLANNITLELTGKPCGKW